MAEGHERHGWAVGVAIWCCADPGGIGCGVAGAFAAGALWPVRAAGSAIGAAAGLAAAIWTDRAYGWMTWPSWTAVDIFSYTLKRLTKLAADPLLDSV
jgi:hypothetical protein